MKKIDVQIMSPTAGNNPSWATTEDYISSE